MNTIDYTSGAVTVTVPTTSDDIANKLIQHLEVDDKLRANAVIDVTTVAQLLRDFADSLDRVVGNQLKEPAGVNILPPVSSVVVNNAQNVSSVKLTKLENNVLKVIQKAKGKFISTWKIEDKVGYADVSSAVRRIRNKTGLQIQAARTIRRATGEIPKTVAGYRLLPSV